MMDWSSFIAGRNWQRGEGSGGTVIIVFIIFVVFSLVMGIMNIIRSYYSNLFNFYIDFGVPAFLASPTSIFWINVTFSLISILILAYFVSRITGYFFVIGALSLINFFDKSGVAWSGIFFVVFLHTLLWSFGLPKFIGNRKYSIIAFFILTLSLISSKFFDSGGGSVGYLGIIATAMAIVVAYIIYTLLAFGAYKTSKYIFPNLT